MAKSLTMPTAPEAPIAPQISIGDRIHGIESRIEEIEGISGMNGNTKSRSNGRQSQQADTEDQQEEQEEEQAQASQQSQSRQTQQRQPSPRKVETPETMARDAVANGSGALTKRTTRRGSDDESQGDDGSSSQPRNQTTVVIPPNSALNDNGQTDFERGRAVLNEFKRLDQEEAARQSSIGADTSSSTSSPGLFAPSYGSNSHGVGYWLFTLIAVGVLAFVFVKQFLVNKNSTSGTPPLTKSMLDIPDISQPSSVARQSALNQYKQAKTSPKPAPPKPPIIKPVTLKTAKSTNKTEDDKKGSHFEVRI